MGLKVAGELGPFGFASPVRLLVCGANEGAQSVAEEIQATALEGDGASSITVLDAASELPGAVAPVQDKTVLLLYLNAQTFLDAGHRVAALVKQAMDLKIPIAPVHEQDSERGGCPFSCFLDQTPAELLQSPYKIFDTLAVPLYPMAEHRRISLRHILRGMGAKPMPPRPARHPLLPAPGFIPSPGHKEEAWATATGTHSDAGSDVGLSSERTVQAPEAEPLTHFEDGRSSLHAENTRLGSGFVSEVDTSETQVMTWLERLLRSEQVSVEQIQGAINAVLEGRTAPQRLEDSESARSGVEAHGETFSMLLKEKVKQDELFEMLAGVELATVRPEVMQTSDVTTAGAHDVGPRSFQGRLLRKRAGKFTELGSSNHDPENGN
eukprot:88046-Rhodomonas_salina.3